MQSSLSEPITEPAAAGLDAQPLQLGWPTLFLAFTRISLTGFGGVLPFAYRGLVERRHWLTDREFSETLAFAQILPGPTICNMSIMIGWRSDGLAGAIASFAGMLAAPTVLVIGLGLTYASVASHPVVQHALAGMSAVAAGLVIATAVKMGLGLLRTERTAEERSTATGFGGLAFAGVGLLQWPLIFVALGLAPFSVALAWWRRRKAQAHGH
ncbi:chromate transporter [soil metagenome]